MDVVEMAVQAARREFAEHLRTAAAEGGHFIDRYAEAFWTGKAHPRPQTGMHPKVRDLAREVVIDELVMVTTRGRRA